MIKSGGDLHSDGGVVRVGAVWCCLRYHGRRCISGSGRKGNDRKFT